MYRTGIRDRFSATHHLVGDFGSETSPHSHDYLVEWSVQAPGLDGDGFATDIDLLVRILSDHVARLDGSHLNDMLEIAGGQPSVERLAKALCGRLAADLQAAQPDHKLVAMAVVIWESDSAFAGYSTDLIRH